MHLKVSIIGAGPAGFALAADLESRGISTLIYSHPTHLRHARNVANKGCLKVSGLIDCRIFPRVTSDMSEIVDFSKTIVLAVPSTGQRTVLHELRSFSLHHHTLIAIPGNLFSLAMDVEIDIGCVIETNLSPYSCRMHEGELAILGRKRLMFAAASSQKELSQVFKDKIQRIFSLEIKWCSNVLEVSLMNVNGVFHPLMMLMNVGRIENTAGDFLLYRDGLTHSVANAMREVDRIRIQICEAFGFRLQNAVEISNECYGQNFGGLVDLAQNSEPHNRLKAPLDIHHRNISEDVSDLLVCWRGLADKLGINASPITAVVVFAQMATGADYMRTGRSLQKLHLEDIPQAELLQIFGAVSLRRYEVDLHPVASCL